MAEMGGAVRSMWKGRLFGFTAIIDLSIVIARRSPGNPSGNGRWGECWIPRTKPGDDGGESRELDGAISVALGPVRPQTQVSGDGKRVPSSFFEKVQKCSGVSRRRLWPVG